MNRIMLMTKVADVPKRVHQRMYSSLPLGKNSNTVANAVGRKIHSDIQIRSVSIIMSSYSSVELIHRVALVEPHKGETINYTTTNDKITQMLTAATTRNST